MGPVRRWRGRRPSSQLSGLRPLRNTDCVTRPARTVNSAPRVADAAPVSEYPAPTASVRTPASVYMKSQSARTTQTATHGAANRVGVALPASSPPNASKTVRRAGAHAPPVRGVSGAVRASPWFEPRAKPRTTNHDRFGVFRGGPALSAAMRLPGWLILPLLGADVFHRSDRIVTLR